MSRPTCIAAALLSTLYRSLVLNAEGGRWTAARFCASIPVKLYMWLSTGLGLARLPVYWQGLLSKVIWFGSSLDTRARMTGG